jgi:hypothetical protein
MINVDQYSEPEKLNTNDSYRSDGEGNFSHHNCSQTLEAEGALDDF